MRLIRLKLLALLFFGFGVAGANAQEAISAAGGEAKGNGGTVSYTLGQLLYHTQSSNAGSMAEGVQQPYEILELPGVGTLEEDNLHSILFPNPVTDHVQLQIENLELDGLTYHLFDLEGRLLEKQEITGTLTSIPMSSLGASNYILRITRSGVELKAFKIIKN